MKTETTKPPTNAIDSNALLGRYFRSEQGYEVDVDSEKQEVELCRECSCGYDVYIFLTKADLKKMLNQLNLPNDTHELRENGE